MTTCSNNRGVSPVIGVILMVAITVVLAAIITVFVTGVGDSLEENATAGVVVEETPEGVKVQVRDMSQAKALQVLVNGQKVDGATLTDVGQYVTVTAPEDATVTVVGETEEGNKSAIASVTTDKDTAGGSSPQVVSTNILHISEPNSSAPSDLSTVLSNMEGSGTSSDPYIITNDHELQAMQEDDDGHFKLGQNIDASKTDQWNGGKGFHPVGGSCNDNTDPHCPFTGSLDGNGYEVRGLTVDRSNEHDAGLFGRIRGANVKNIGVVNASITGKSYVGGLVGNSENSTINNAYVTGTVNSTGNSIAGGLSGYAYKDTISNSYSKATVDGPDETGGLVGVATGDSSTGTDITNSYATGNVTGNDRVGGLVGQMFDTANVTDSYATGDVSGGNDVGGVVGWSEGTIKRTYATGSVSGSSDLGGVIGDQYGGSLSGSYWDTQSTGQSSATGTSNGTVGSGVTGYTTSEMQGSSAESNMTAFDWTSTWATRSDDYPTLQD